MSQSTSHTRTNSQVTGLVTTSETEPEDDHHLPPANYSDPASAWQEERLGRFYGPDATWREFTRAERDAAASLDQTECDDLSLHLYNTHALKRRLYKPEEASSVRSAQPKETWMSPPQAFRPDQAWSAWPLPPESVPRRQEKWGAPASWPDDDPSNYFKREPWLPGRDLRGELEAVALRISYKRQRLQSSIDRWQHDRSQLSSSHHDQEGYQDTKDHAITDQKPPSNDDDASFKGRPSSHEESLWSLSEASSVVPAGDTKHSNAPQKIQILSSPKILPVPLLDDDLASQILQPSIHTIMHHLDNVLAGLHQSRMGHTRGRFPTKQPPRGSPRGSKEHDRDNRRRKLHEPEDNTSGAPSKHGGRERSKAELDANARQRTKRRVGCRDWSEILAVAAMLGWDLAAVDRAARRCAALFGECMDLRIMPRLDSNEAHDVVIHYGPGDANIGDERFPVAGAGQQLFEHDQDTERHHYGCPHGDCDRNRNPYRTRWELRQHLRRKHRCSSEEIANILKVAESVPISDFNASIERRAPQSDLDPLLAPISIRMPGSRRQSAKVESLRT